MQKLAIIGASYLQKPLVCKAKEMGLYTLCFAWRDGAVCADIVDEFYDISIVEKEQILSICAEAQIDGICTIASDVAAPTVAYIAEKMGLVGNLYEAAVKANNKYLMRNALIKAGVPCPKYMCVTPKTLHTPDAIDSLRKFHYPIIVKPSDRSGSLGVTKVETLEEYYSAINLAIEKSFKHEAMIEEYIEGREISVEFISYNGIHYPLQITDKVTTEAPHFVELEHHQPSSLTEEMFCEIYEITKNALSALGVTNGASHSEYKITSEGHIAVMEIGGRMGGDFIGSDLVRLSTGYDFVRGVIEVALGNFKIPQKTMNKYAGVYFLCGETPYIKQIIDNKDKYAEIVQAEISNPELKDVSCSADRSGYFIYQSDRKMILTHEG